LWVVQADHALAEAADSCLGVPQFVHDVLSRAQGDADNSETASGLAKVYYLHDLQRCTDE